jgi:O-Antigen ligase
MPSVEPAVAIPFDQPRPVHRVGLRRVAQSLPVAAILVAVAALSFLSGGYIFSRTAPVVVLVIPLVAVWVWLAPRRPGLDAAALVALSALALFALWEGLSIAWSVGPDLSWVAFDVTMLYLIVACVATVTPAGPVQLRLTGYGFVCAMVPVAVYAFLGKVLPDVVTHAHLYARLSAPVGYWNVLAVMLVMATVPALEGASRRGLPAAARGAFSGTLALFLLTLFFTFSRGGTLALALALVVYFALTNERLQGALTLVLTVAPVAAVLYHVRHLGTLFDATDNGALRSAQGHAFGRWAVIAIAIAVVAQVAAALLTRRLRLGGRWRTALGAVVLAVAVVAVAAGVASFAARHGGLGSAVHTVVRQFSSTNASANPSTAGAGRLLALGNDGRISMMREGLRSFPHHPLAGTGAGTFQIINDLYRPNGMVVVRHAHDQWINVLSELGLVGLVLFVLGVGGLLVAALRPVGRAARDADRGLLAALQAAAVAFVAHLTIDWDWDMAAATLAFLLFAGVAAAYVRGRRSQRTSVDSLAAFALAHDAGHPAAPATAHDAEDAGHRAALTPVQEPVAAGAGPDADRGWRLGPASRALATGVLVLVGLSFAAPYLSQRALSRAVDLSGAGHTAAAAAQARRAHRLDPLAVDPMFTLALVEQQQGRAGAALATLQQAVRLQPQNYETYYQLGVMQLDVLGQRGPAAVSLRRALALNPYDTGSSDELSVALAPAATP